MPLSQESLLKKSKLFNTYYQRLDKIETPISCPYCSHVEMILPRNLEEHCKKEHRYRFYSIFLHYPTCIWCGNKWEFDEEIEVVKHVLKCSSTIINIRAGITDPTLIKIMNKLHILCVYKGTATTFNADLNLEDEPNTNSLSDSQVTDELYDLNASDYEN